MNSDSEVKLGFEDGEVVGGYNLYTSLKDLLASGTNKLWSRIY